MAAAAKKPFLIIKTRESTYTDPSNGFEPDKFLYSRNPTVNVQNIINDFKAKMISSPSGLIGAEPGYYTWILRGIENKRTKEFTDLKLYAIKTLSKQEIGTLHANLDLYSSYENTNPIVAAGELQITDSGEIKFNLLSGTFMKPIFNRINGRASQNSLKNKLITKFIELFPNYSKPEFFECTTGCSDEEKLGGTKIIETNPIYTSLKNLKYLRQYFTSPINNQINAKALGGKTSRRHKTRKSRRCHKTRKCRK